MKVTSAQFLKSALRPEDYPRDRRPEIAFVGRSNVGKSSLLNRLLNRKGLAKTSSTPGKTQTINFFDINGTIYFVDLPGYGFAKVPKALKNEWNRVMVEYLKDRETLRLAVVLLDSRHDPSPLDAHMLDLLEDAQTPTLLVATKIDKVSKGRRDAQIQKIRRGLSLDHDVEIIPFSAETGEGVRPLWEIIDRQMAHDA